QQQRLGLIIGHNSRDSRRQQQLRVLCTDSLCSLRQLQAAVARRRRKEGSWFRARHSEEESGTSCPICRASWGPASISVCTGLSVELVSFGLREKEKEGEKEMIKERRKTARAERWREEEVEGLARGGVGMDGEGGRREQASALHALKGQMHYPGGREQKETEREDEDRRWGDSKRRRRRRKVSLPST
ncbi:unnamed protein product, partial [Pleuronectes platessa]